MAVAIPAKARQVKNLPKGTRVKNLNATQIHQFPDDATFWESSGPRCQAGFVANFFTGVRKRRAAAFLGSVPYDACGTIKIVAENVRVYTNEFSIAQTGQRVAVTCTCPVLDGGKCHPAATILDAVPDQSGKRQLHGTIINSRAIAGNDGAVLVTFTENKHIFRFKATDSDSGGVPWPDFCKVSTLDGAATRVIIRDSCPTETDLNFVHHLSAGSSTVFSTAPFSLGNSRASHLKVSCSLYEIDSSMIDSLLASCHDAGKMRRRLAESKGAKPSAPKSKVAVKTGEPLPGMLSGLDSHLDFSRPMRETSLEKEIEETRSRVNVLSNAVRAGHFGEFGEVIRRAEQYEEDVREAEQIVSAPRTMIDQVWNQYIQGPTAVNWAIHREQRAFDVGYVIPIMYMNGGLNGEGRSGYYATGTHGNLLNVLLDESTQTANIGFAKKLYGVNVDVSTGTPAAAYEVRARNVDVITAVDSIDRAFGQRIAVRNFGISLRRDLDDVIDVADSDFGTEVYVQYRTINVALGADVLDTRYYISIGLLGVNVIATRDFDSYASNLQINWGRGWQIFIEGDFPDDGNLRVGEAVGVGKPNRMYLAAGAGVGPEGLPVAAVNLQTPHSAIGVGWLERAGSRIQQYAITAGRYTYFWENTLLPDNISLPQL